MNRWSKNGILDRGFKYLQFKERLVRIKLEAVSLDSTNGKVTSQRDGRSKKRAAGHRQVSQGMDH